MSARRGIALAVAFAALWAVLEVALGSRLSRRYDLLQVVWTRYATHLALMLLLFGWVAPAMLWRTRRPGFQLARSAMMLVMPAGFAFALAAGTGPHTVWAQFWVAPLLILALARWWLREPVAPLLWGCAAVVAAAGLLFHPPRMPSSAAAVVLPAAMSASFCVYVAATRILREEPLRANLFYTAVVPFLALTPYMPFAWQTPNLHDAIVLAGIGAVGLAMLAALDRAVHGAGVSLIAPVIGIQLPFAALLAAAERGEWPYRRELLATVIVLAVVAWLWRGTPARGPAEGAAVPAEGMAR